MEIELWRKLTDKEKVAYRKWARDNYKPLSLIDGLWHPIVQEECAKINREGGIKWTLK